MNAFRKGFNAVFPIERLGSFAPEEVSFVIMRIKPNYCIKSFTNVYLCLQILNQIYIFRLEQCYVAISVQSLPVKILFAIPNQSWDTAVILRRS